MIRLLVIVLVGLTLAGCAATGPASITGGECKIFERPEYAVRGKRPYDQNWIDSQVEGGVGGCGWKRPAPRPAALDAPRATPAAQPVMKRPSLIRRIRNRVMPADEHPEPMPYIAAPLPSAEPAVAPVAPPPPRDRVDELLRPDDPRVIYPK